MQDKLQELTDKLFNEGLSKGKQEGEALLADARKKADAIVRDAKKQAEAIIEQANKDAEDLKVKVGSDLKMASSQALQATKKDIENLVISSLSDKEVAGVLSSEDFVKGVISAVAEKFSTQEAADLDIVLPESMKSSLVPFIQNELSKKFKNGVNATFSKKIAGGFTIGPKDGSYFISLTDETFKSLISEYLRPVTRKLLFGE